MEDQEKEQTDEGFRMRLSKGFRKHEQELRSWHLGYLRVCMEDCRKVASDLVSTTNNEQAEQRDTLVNTLATHLFERHSLSLLEFISLRDRYKEEGHER